MGGENAKAAKVRQDAFAEVSHAMNLVADIWERDGSDPCRVRVTREYANAYRLYAEGLGEPTGSARFRAALPGPDEPEVTDAPCCRYCGEPGGDCPHVCC